MQSPTSSNEYTELAFPKLSVVGVAPFTTPSFPLPLTSFALPLKSYPAQRPLVMGTAEAPELQASRPTTTNPTERQRAPNARVDSTASQIPFPKVSSALDDGDVGRRAGHGGSSHAASQRRSAADSSATTASEGVAPGTGSRPYPRRLIPNPARPRVSSRAVVGSGIAFRN